MCQNPGTQQSCAFANLSPDLSVFSPVVGDWTSVSHKPDSSAQMHTTPIRRLSKHIEAISGRLPNYKILQQRILLARVGFCPRCRSSLSGLFNRWTSQI